MAELGKITSKSIELRRGLLTWEWKWIEDGEHKWRKTAVPSAVEQAVAADIIAAEVMARFPEDETVGLTVLVRRDQPGVV